MEALVLAAVIGIVALVVFTKYRQTSKTMVPSNLPPAAPTAATLNEANGSGPEKIPCDGNDHQTASWIWKNLVPKAGQSLTLQGELLRAVEKLRYEAQSNGNINWDDNFDRFIDFLHEHLVIRSTLPDATKLSIVADLSRLRDFLPVDQLEEHSQDQLLPEIEDELYDRLTSGVVAFSRLNSTVIPRETDPGLYR